MTLGTPDTLLILLATVVSLLVFVRALVGVARRGEWSAAATEMLLLVLLTTSLIDIVVALSDQWVTSADAFGNTVVALPSWAYLTQLGFYLLILVGAAVPALTRISRPGAHLNLPALLFLGLACLSDGSALLNGDDPVRPFYVIPLVILAATTVAPRGLSVHLGLATGCLISALASGFSALFVPATSLLHCGPGDCGLFDANFRGVLVNQNALAMYLALAMPFVYVAFGHRDGALLGAYLLFLILLTGSRSGSIAAVITFVVLLLVRPTLRRPAYSSGRAFFLYAVLAVAALGGVLAPLLIRDPEALTRRGYLWGLARARLADWPHLLLGRGALGWGHVREEGLIDYSETYSTHNQWLQTVFSAGLVGAAVLIAALAVLLVQAGRRHRLVVGCVLTPALALGIAERPWAIDYLDWLVWALPGALLCYSVSHSGTPALPSAPASSSAVNQSAALSASQLAGSGKTSP